MNRNDKHLVLHHLLSSGIPRWIIDLDLYFTNLMTYVNDAIGFRMKPEVILAYSDFCFGTADAISFRNDILRVHDLKTGSRPAHMEQLLVYAALYCLEYKVKPRGDRDRTSHLPERRSVVRPAYGRGYCADHGRDHH